MSKDRVRKHLERNNSTICSFPMCEEFTIYSHAISKKISIASIAENGHLTFFKPKRHGPVKNPKFDQIGVNDCSGFNGFCKDHDDIFQPIDQNLISTSEDVKLQLYRSLSFELHKEKVGFYQKVDVDDEHANQVLTELNIIDCESKSTEKLRNIVKRKFEFIQRESLDDKLFKIEKLSFYMLHLLKVKDDFEFKNDEFYTFSTENMKNQAFYYMTSFSIPVAINTKVSLVVDDGLNYYFTVVPYKNKSLIMGIIPDGSPEFIQEKLNKVFNSDLSIIKFVESIISSCDGWYLKPSIVESMPVEKRNVFLNDSMFINERRFYKDYDLSIFDDLKMEVCGLEANDVELCRVPVREDYESRYKAMIEVINRSII